MLAFLDSLCAALIARDAGRVRELLGHPLARALPRVVRDEAVGFAAGARGAVVAPVHALRLYHQTAHLLGTSVDPATARAGTTTTAASGRRQMELPLGNTAALR